MKSLIDARIARTVARALTGPPTPSGSYLMERLERDLEHALPRAEDLVAQASGIARPPAGGWGIVTRGAWVEANVAGMERLLQPVAERILPRLDRLPWPARVAQRAAISSEIGGLLGYISRRVLGQYDVLVTEVDERRRPRRGTRSLRPGTDLYFVGQNIIETEQRLGFVPSEFALWVALHEVTHRFQFVGVPWLRGRFFDLISSYLASLDLDAGGLARRLASAGRRLFSGDLPPEERNPVYLLASEDQRRALDDLQALMAVVEGHGNYVMDAVGRDVIPSFRRMRRAFERRRRNAGALQRAINHAIGLEMKLRQYELGQSFCEAVAAREGPAAIARLWDDPALFPTLPELRDPDRWLRRVA